MSRSRDLRSLYPNLHAETTRHPSSSLSMSPRPSSGKGGAGLGAGPADRKPHHRSREELRSSSSTRGPSQFSKPTTASASFSSCERVDNQSHTRAETAVGAARGLTALGGSTRTMPVLLSSVSTGTLDGRPATTTSVVDMQPRHQRQRTSGSSHELSFMATQPAKRQQHQHHYPQPLTTRSVVLRGEATAHDPERIPMPSRARNPSSSSIVLSTRTDLPLQDIVVCNARPRSRYARREAMASPIQPLLSLSASTPSISGEINGPPPLLRGSRSTGTLIHQHPSVATKRDPHAVAAQTQTQLKPRMISWTEQDTASFFLTEIDAKEAADQWKIARALAQGSHYLYARSEYERAVACFADALAVVKAHQDQHDQQQQPRTSDNSHYTSLLSLLHHHMGVAFKEDGQDKWALLMQKKALELAQLPSHNSGDRKLQARALKALGVLFLDRQDLQQALECQQQALAIAEELQDQELQARVFANLGNLASAQQQLQHAISCHERDLACSSSAPWDSAVGQARAHHNLALVYGKMAETAKNDGEAATWQHNQLDHHVQAARLQTANAFETDMRRHAADVVGNIYCQLTTPDAAFVEMVASSLTDLLTATEQEDDDK